VIDETNFCGGNELKYRLGSQQAKAKARARSYNITNVTVYDKMKSETSLGAFCGNPQSSWCC